MKTIFLVDDSATILLSISGILTKAGYAVEKAPSALDALKKVQAGVKVDLLITDLNMPGMNGIDFIKEVRKLPAYRITRDGFTLAELDLAQRREGDVLGADQSGGRSTLRLLRVLDHADLISAARVVAEEAVRRDPACTTPGFADAVAQTNLLAGGEWIERS